MLDVLHLLGFNNITAESDSIIIYASSIFLMSLLALLCFINLAIYFSIITFIDNKLLNNLESTIETYFKVLPTTYIKKLGKILNTIILFYRGSRIFYIIFEIILFIWIMFTLIYTSYIIISA